MSLERFLKLVFGIHFLGDFGEKWYLLPCSVGGALVVFVSSGGNGMLLCSK